MMDHENELFDAFPGYENFTFDTQFYESIEDRDIENYDDLHGIDGFDGELTK